MPAVHEFDWNYPFEIGNTDVLSTQLRDAKFLMSGRIYGPNSWGYPIRHVGYILSETIYSKIIKTHKWNFAWSFALHTHAHTNDVRIFLNN